MKIDLASYKNKKYILACSFGPDSMMLFDILQKNNIDFIVCHVNYHKRDISNYEQEQLLQYCENNGIICKICDTSSLIEDGNFQGWARKIRYDFFKQIYDEYECEGVFVAHHLDDLLETYLMQIKRNSKVRYYGINEISIVNSMKIIRPLLNITKEEILNYNHIHQIPFSIDISNNNLKYTRNKIRHENVFKMSIEEKKNLLKEIQLKNEKNVQKKEQFTKYFEQGKYLDISYIKTISEDDFYEILTSFLEDKIDNINISKSLVKEIYKVCYSKKPNVSILIDKNLYLVKEYSRIVIVKISDDFNYNYILKQPDILKTKFFELDFSKGAEDRNILSSSYPITVRTFRQNDTYKINNYVCNVSRLFIDWKMPIRLRKIWPLFVDKNNNIIYIPRYRIDDKTVHKSYLKILTDSFIL